MTDLINDVEILDKYLSGISPYELKTRHNLIISLRATLEELYTIDKVLSRWPELEKQNNRVDKILHAIVAVKNHVHARSAEKKLQRIQEAFNKDYGTIMHPDQINGIVLSEIEFILSGDKESGNDPAA